MKNVEFQWNALHSLMIFDFYIPEKNIIVMLDGDHILQSDRNKHNMSISNYVRLNGYTLVRLLELDVLGNSYDLMRALQMIIKDQTEGGVPTTFYICQNLEYKHICEHDYRNRLIAVKRKQGIL